MFLLNKNPINPPINATGTITGKAAVEKPIVPIVYRVAMVLPAAIAPPLATAAVLIIPAAVEPAAIPEAVNPIELTPIKAPTVAPVPIAAPSIISLFF